MKPLKKGEENFDQYEKYTGKRITNLTQKQPNLKEPTERFVKKYSAKQVKSYYGKEY